MGGAFAKEEFSSSLFDEQMTHLRPVTHRLLSNFCVVAYGVLGVRESSPQSALPAPGRAIDAVIVDSAFAGQIGTRNEPGLAKHGRRAIYTWLGITTSAGGGPGRFPDEVHNYFKADRDEDAEGLAKYHRYGRGQHVIHAVGPVLREVEASVQALTKTYANILKQFCTQIAAQGGGLVKTRSATHNTQEQRPDVPRTLRMLPISTDGLVQSPELAKHVGTIFWSALAIALNSLPNDMLQTLRQSRVEVCIFKDHQVKLFEDALDEKRKALNDALCLGPDMGATPKIDGKYDWIRKFNGDEQRIDRLAASSKTFQAVWDQRYQLPDTKVVALMHVDKMLAGTSIRRADDPIEAANPDNAAVFNNNAVASKSTNVAAAPSDTASRKVTKVVIAKDVVMNVAATYAREGKIVAAVNAASAHHIGGGVLTGGRHALEEAWCMTSTLLKSLQEAEYRTMGQFPADVGYLPQDGVVLSPLVEIFRGGTDTGYAFLAEPAVLAGVVSVAMYNCNAKVKDSPVDVPFTLDEYERGVCQKIRAMLKGASELGAHVLICPDIGCGVFENNPEKVGSLLGEVLREEGIAGLLEEVVVTGNREFSMAVAKASNGEKVPCAWSPPTAEQRLALQRAAAAGAALRAERAAAEKASAANSPTGVKGGARSLATAFKPLTRRGVAMGSKAPEGDDPEGREKKCCVS